MSRQGCPNAGNLGFYRFEHLQCVRCRLLTDAHADGCLLIGAVDLTGIAWRELYQCDFSKTDQVAALAPLDHQGAEIFR